MCSYLSLSVIPLPNQSEDPQKTRDAVRLSFFDSLSGIKGLITISMRYVPMSQTTDPFTLDYFNPASKEVLI